MSLRLVIEDNLGNITRQIPVTEKKAQVIQRMDTKRLEVVTDTAALVKNKIQFSKIADLDFDEMKNEKFPLGNFGSLRLVKEVAAVPVDGSVKQDGKKDLKASVLLAFAIFLMLLSIVRFAPKENAKVTEELKQQVVKIVQTKEMKKKTVAPTTNMMADQTATKMPTKRAELVKRSGALAALGSLRSGKQRGGLNLGAVNTTAGIGLGGTGGSGGVQTSLYGKGITSAPLGSGANINGGGGYGTKGKGGGQAGYGSLSLVGSAGGAPVPLGAEAEVAQGLDRSAIDEVIRRNLGQVRFCYEQALQGAPQLSGRVAMGFTIGGNGLVKTAQVESSSMANKGVEDCITMRLKTWKFPVPQGGVDVKVTYPFVLRRQGQG
ncbi:AgmX/PglI C-terminal domain-containing protein [Bdellovibrio sp. HCB-162]|uniref:AgmX/PglI C-terminal domain-containing protein n=1 Tax=Bdellovibrio sp. HCB-162 TaxID=3394234 RepID=UPI0039BC7DEF